MYFIIIILKCVVYCVSPLLCDYKGVNLGCVFIHTNIPTIVPSANSAGNNTPTNHNPPHPSHHFYSCFQFTNSNSKVLLQYYHSFLLILTSSKLLRITSYHYEVITWGYSCCSVSAESRIRMHENHAWAQTRNFRSSNESFWINSKR